MAGENAFRREVAVEIMPKGKKQIGQPFAASSWLGVGSHDKQLRRARATLPSLRLRVRVALPNSASSRSEGTEEKERALFVYGSDALSAVHRLLWYLPIAWSGRERPCHCKKNHLVARDQASFTA